MWWSHYKEPSNGTSNNQKTISSSQFPTRSQHRPLGANMGDLQDQPVLGLASQIQGRGVERIRTSETKNPQSENRENTDSSRIIRERRRRPSMGLCAVSGKCSSQTFHYSLCNSTCTVTLLSLFQCKMEQANSLL